MRGIAAGIFGLVLVATLANADDDLDRRTEAVRVITEAATDICYTVEQRAQKSDSQINGDVDGKVSAVFSKLLNLGLRGSLSEQQETSEGVTQEALASALKHSIDCRNDVFHTLVGRMLPDAPNSSPQKLSIEDTPRPIVDKTPSVTDARSCTDPAIADEKNRSLADAFKKAVEKHKDLIGEPVGCLTSLGNTSRGGFEHATEIWTSDPRQILLLFSSTDRQTWDVYRESEPCEYDWCELNKEAVRRTHFEHLFGKIPSGLHPPFAGTALLLNENKDLFKKIGWQRWQCERVTSAFHQRFAKAEAYGIYQSQYKDTEGQVFVLLDDRSWRVLSADVHVPVCGPGSF